MASVSMNNDKNRETIHIEELYGLNACFQEFMHVYTVPDTLTH
jgi:hypothetical protein